MNAKEARRYIGNCGEGNPNCPDKRHWRAEGYLECLEGEEMKALVAALENRVHCLACQTHEHPTTKEALSKYRESLK